jgi:hypothetical protein
MKTRWFTALGLVTLGGASALGGCSEDPNGSSGGGTSSGGSAPTAGSSNGGALVTSGAGNGGSVTTAGTTNGGSATAGTNTGGSAGAGGTAGSAGAGGTAGSAGAGGTAGSAGSAGTTGEGGEGGLGGDSPTLVYDFETDAQGWTSEGEGVVVTTDTAQKITGEKSLKVTVPALAANATQTVAVASPPFWPGTVLTIHVYSPAGTDGLWVQAYTQSNNWATWDTAGNIGVALVRAGWTTITYTVPETFPGGLQSLGIQMGVNAQGPDFAGGDFYIDSITAEGGTASCAGTGEGEHGFEADASGWTLDGDPAPTDTVIAHSTDEAKTGTGSLKVSFTALPAGTPAAPTSRRIRIENPVAYCTQEVTFNVWMPPGSESILFQGYAQFDNYAGWNAGALPAAITRDGWTEQKYTLPAVGAGGLQLLGVQIMNTGAAAFTGDVYIDDVSW